MKRSASKEIRDHSKLSRGVIVLDHDAAVLAPALRQANIIVFEYPAEAPTFDTLRDYLSHRIVVTRNPQAFVEEAPIHEYGIVSLQKLASIDPSPAFATNKTARLISRTLSRYRLWTKGAKFLLELQEDGDHNLVALE